MRFTSLGSGSKGNATVVHCGETRILIDCGFSVREMEKRLSLRGMDASELSAILVTHEHTDHIRGVLPLARKYQLPVMLTSGTSKSLKEHSKVNLILIDSNEHFSVGELELTPVSVAHDAREPVQFVIRSRGLTLGVLTDLGSITPHVLECYGQCDGLLIEFNHDAEMLAKGSYPTSLKNRVGGAWGHLNNQQALHLLQNIQMDRLQQLVICHVSQQNNSVALIKERISVMASQLPAVHYACQDQGLSWVELHSDLA
jgi:phosphoribosyl 1,2-cyclic phosphodiesterase